MSKQKILFFTRAAVITPQELERAKEIGFGVVFRNSQMATGTVEKDVQSVAGNVPPEYAEFPRADAKMPPLKFEARKPRKQPRVVGREQRPVHTALHRSFEQPTQAAPAESQKEFPVDPNAKQPQPQGSPAYQQPHTTQPMPQPQQAAPAWPQGQPQPQNDAQQAAPPPVDRKQPDAIPAGAPIPAASPDAPGSQSNPTLNPMNPDNGQQALFPDPAPQGQEQPSQQGGNATAPWKNNA